MPFACMRIISETELNPAENTAQQEKGHLGMEIEDHFRNRHLKLASESGRLPHPLFQFCHIAINRGTIKWHIRLVAAAAVKGVASRAHNARLPRFFQFMRDAMQPANHGAIRIQDAAGINVKGAHQSDGLPIVAGLFERIHNGDGPRYYRVLRFDAQSHQPLFKITILNEGVMVKSGAAAIVPTPIAGETILFGRPVIGVVHGGIDAPQLLYEIGQNRGFNMIYPKGKVHCSIRAPGYYTRGEGKKMLR